MEVQSSTSRGEERYKQLSNIVQQLAAEIKSLNKKQDENEKRQEERDNSMKIMFEWFQKQVQTQTIAEEQSKRKENILASAIESSSVEMAGMKREQIEIKKEQKEETEARKNLTRNVQEFATQVMEEETKSKHQPNKTNKENERRQEIARNLQDIILDANDNRLAYCNKSYGEAHIQNNRNLEITHINYPETVEKIRCLQNELKNKQIQFTEWNLYLSSHCRGNVYDHCLDQRKNIKSWTEIIISMFRGISFELMNTELVFALKDKTPTEGQELGNYIEELIDAAKSVKGLHVMPYVICRIKNELTKAHVNVGIPDSYNFRTFQDLQEYLKDATSPHIILQPYRPPYRQQSKAELFQTNIVDRGWKKPTRKIQNSNYTPYYCLKCYCDKCKRSKYNKNGKLGYCFDCTYQSCQNKLENYKSRRKVKINLIEKSVNETINTSSGEEYSDLETENTLVPTVEDVNEIDKLEDLQFFENNAQLFEARHR